ncbi:MAG: hypothetical protein EX254_00165 [Flavobacteriaceae bacterium]|nr:MAG: hypothetical protein EX254_00165 [Flavobacteriaceae bacterium]
MKTNVISEEVSSCPEDGKCIFEVLPNKSIQITKTSLNEIYPKLIDGNKVVLRFDYKRNEMPDVQDSSYNEIILVEIDPNAPEVELNGKRMSEAKLFFARFCFCRGQTGYYVIDQGNLKIEKLNGNHYSFELNFKTDEVPQIITSIDEEFTLE